MDILTGIIALIVFYCIIYFFDTFFKTCAHYPYIQFLEGTGFQIKLFQIKWITKAFNRTLIRWGNNRPHFLHLWFTIGVCVSLILLPIAICLLFIGLFQNVFLTTVNQVDSKLIIEPLIPGINLPASELGYYGLALVLCSVIHEIGHALAAVKEDVNVNYLAVTVIFCLPIAYVNIGTDKLFSLSRWKILKVLCAGIWHNVVLSILAYILYLTVPYVFSLCYQVGSGVAVSYIVKHSPLLGNNGVNVNDVIIKINDCTVTDEVTWFNCLSNIQMHKPAFCLESDLIHNLDESIPLKHLDNGNMDCCDSKRTGNLCFEYLDSADGILELPSYVCLPGRLVVEKSSNFCTFNSHVCPNDFYCFRPLLSNNTNLFKIIRRNKPDVIYLGFVSDFYRTIEVSSYIPQYIFKTTLLPDVLTKYFKYVIVFSLGLAIINIIPCMFFDGQHVIGVLLQILFLKNCGKDVVNLMTNIITWLFTVLLVFHCFYYVSKFLFL